MDVCSVAGGVGEGRKDTSHHTAPPLPIMVSRQRSGASCPNLTTVCEVASMDKPPKVSSASRLPPTLISRKHSTPAYTRRMQMVSSIRTAAPTTPLLGRVHFYINPALGQDCSSVRLRRHVSQLGRLNTIDTPTRPVRSPRHNPPCECSTRIDRVQCSTQISREKLQSASQFECPAPHPLTQGMSKSSSTMRLDAAELPGAPLPLLQSFRRGSQDLHLRKRIRSFGDLYSRVPDILDNSSSR